MSDRAWLAFSFSCNLGPQPVEMLLHPGWVTSVNLTGMPRGFSWVILDPVVLMILIITLIILLWPST